MIDDIKEYTKNELENNIPGLKISSIDLKRENDNIYLDYISFIYDNKKMSMRFKEDKEGTMEDLIEIVKNKINRSK